MRLALVLVAACSTSAPGPTLDLDRELAHVAALTTIGPRPADTPAARATASYIETALGTIPLEKTPVGDIDLPAIDVLGTRFRDARRTHVDDPDLVARFGPSGKALLFMAHYDTMPGSPGAVDNSAAVAVLIELAKELAAHPPQQPVMIAFTADEEHGLVGSEALAARHGDEVELAIALDMIGGSGRLTLNGASELIGRSEMQWLARTAERTGVVIDAPLSHRVISRWWPQAERADHGVFTRHGIRAFHLYHRGQDGLWIDTAYHSPRDVLARVDRGSLDEMSRLARGLVATPIPAHRGDGFWVPLVNVIVPRWCLLAGDCVLAALGCFGLGALVLVSRGSHKRGAGLWLGLLCFAAAVAAAVVANHPIDLDPARISLVHVTQSLVGSALVIAGLLGLLTRILARKLPWIGANRYLALAIVPLLAIGIALLAIGAAELAWVWLAPAAVLALAPRLPRVLAPVAVLLAALPAALVLWPNQLLEAAWNAFLPVTVPLSILIALIAGPAFAAITWWWRSHTARGPLGTLVLPVGCGLSAAVGLLLEITR